MDLQINTKLIPTQGVFMDGQVFDAYELTSRIIRSAKQHIVLIDNYIDEQTFTQLSKKQSDVLHPPLSSLEGGSVSLLHLALMYSSATKHFSPYEGGLRGMTISN